MTKPYELLARFNRDGTVAGVSVRTITTVSGREFEGDPQPLAGTSAPAFTAFADQFSAAVVAERDAAVAAKTAAETALAAATAERDAARAEVERLTAELEAIRNPTDGQGFPVLSAVQLREGMVEAGIYDRVQDAIKAIPDDRERLRFTHYFEYRTEFHRGHPMIATMAQAVGLSDDEVDTFWRAAGAIA
jgi:hypothetical protein